VLRKFAAVSILAALAAGTASADTLREALVSTYQTNPTITAQRSGQPMQRSRSPAPPAGRRSAARSGSTAT
jgi:hypothetical protein